VNWSIENEDVASSPPISPANKAETDFIKNYQQQVATRTKGLMSTTVQKVMFPGEHCSTLIKLAPDFSEVRTCTIIDIQLLFPIG
jgi:hypothetical protein